MTGRKGMKNARQKPPFRFTLTDGTTPPPGSPSTGWAFTDAVLQRRCPVCQSEAGFYCITKKERKVWPPHSERVVIGPEHRIKTISPMDFLTGRYLKER